MSQELQLGKYQFYPYEFEENEFEENKIASLEELLERYREISEDEETEDESH
jgi:hypothetical protein